MSRFLRLCAFLFVLVFTGNAFAAGYSCPTYMKYTSCNAGYYMVGSQTSTTYDGTPKAGNRCIACSNAGTGCTCAAGTGAPVCNLSVTCSAGKYIAKGATTCSSTCEAGYKCPGGTFTIAGGGATDVTGRTACSAASEYQNATGQSSCKSVSDGYYKNGNTAQQVCGTGYYCKSGVRTACTSYRANTTTTSTTASTASSCVCEPGRYLDSSNVCTSCALGTYKSGAGNGTCTSASSGYYVNTRGAASQTACTSWRADTNTNGATGSTSQSACVCRAGTYLNGSTCTSCAAGTYKSANSNATSCTTASSGYYVSSTGATSQSACTSWRAYTNTNGKLGSTSTSACVCKAGTYLNGSTCTPCAAGTYKSANSNATSCTTASSGYFVSATGATSQTACTSWRANTNTNGATGSTSTSACVCKAGTYLNGSTCTVCGPGTFKSANSNATSCSNVNAGCYADKTGSTSECPTSCPSGYPNSGAGSYAITHCYSNTKSRAWTGSQTACSKPSGCATVSCSTCSIAACDYIAYSNSAGTGDGTVKSGCETNNAACQQGIASVTANANNYVSGTTCPACTGLGAFYTTSAGGAISSSSCYGTTTGGKYIKTQYSSTQETCTAGSYCPATNVYYGKYSTNGGGLNGCPSGYGAGSTGYSQQSQCLMSVAGGKYVAKQYESAASGTCAGGTYKASHTVNYGSTSSCSTCSAGYYCPAGSSGQTACGSNAKYSSSGASSCTDVSTGYYTTGGGSTTRTGQTKCEAGNYCSGGVKTACGGGKYSADGATSCSNISAGCYGTSATSACPNSCAKGTYSTGGAAACTNVNAGCYADTTGSTSACPKSCPAGTYGSTTGLTSSACSGSCTAGYYCTAGSTSSKQNNCPAGSYCPTGSGSATACGGGKWSAANSASCSSINAGCYGTSGTSACPFSCAKGSYSTGGATTCTYCPAGTYGDTTGLTSSACSGICAAGYYCTTGSTSSKQNACPSATTNAPTSFPANYYSPSVESASITSGPGASKAEHCQALYWYKSTRGKFYEYSNYDTSTGRYKAVSVGGWHAANPGYYLTNKSGCGMYAYYSTAEVCPAGSYCPGKSSVSCDSSNQSTVHTTNFGLNSCPSGYSNSATQSDAITDCYSDTKKRAMTSCSQNACSNPDTTGCSGVTCAASCSCAGTTCDYVAYSNSDGTGDGTVKSGCTTNAQSCTKAVTSLTAKSNYYVNGTTSCPTCSSKDANYPSSDGGNIGYGSCYVTRTNTGTEKAPVLPDGCAAQTVNSCTKPTCNYKDYAGQTGETCSPGTCQQTHKACTSASTNYYLDTGVAKACSAYSASYPSSNGGNITSGSCYGSFSKSGSQVNGSVPNNCSKVTEWGTCTPGSCNYTKYASGTIKTDCTPNNCTKPVVAVAAKTGYYDAGTTCTACPSGYPNSTADNEGGITKCYSNTKSRPWSGGQNACSKPSGCATVSCSTCSIAACDYVAYSNNAGTGDGTVKSGCETNNAACQQGIASVTANANNYVSGTTCPACPSAYPSSDGGSIGEGSCYVAKTNTGSQLACSTPSGCASSTCGTCTPGTCTWRDYKTATDTTCTPTNCTKPVASVTASANNYVSGTTCPSCSSLNSAYPYSNSGNSNGTAACFTSCGAGTYVAESNKACTNVGAGYYRAAHNVNYGATSTRNACAGGLTTIGYGAGADEAADCGRKLHAGSNTVYLRSAAKDSSKPSLRVKVGDTVFFGTLSTAIDNALKINYNGTEYSVVDDSM